MDPNWRIRYELAIERYQEFAALLPDRIEGLAAKLKIGLCHVRLDQHEEALKVLQSLGGKPSGGGGSGQA